MLNIVLLMAGVGKRFSEVGYKEPKPLIKTFYRMDNGKLLEDVEMYKVVLWNTISQLPLKSIKNISIVARPEYKVDLNELVNFLERCYYFEDKGNLEYFIKNKEISYDLFETTATSGALIAARLPFGETCLKDDDDRLWEELLILNCDQLIKFDRINFLNQYSHLENGCTDGILLHFNEVEGSKKWGYSKLSEYSGNVLSIHEKEPLTNFAHTGHYFFSKVIDFMSYGKRIIENDIKVNGEFFLSPVYEEMIRDGENISAFVVDKFIGLGVPEDFEKYDNSYRQKNNITKVTET